MSNAHSDIITWGKHKLRSNGWQFTDRVINVINGRFYCYKTKARNMSKTWNFSAYILSLLKLGVSMERKTYERSREKKVISFAGNDGEQLFNLRRIVNEK